MCSTNTSASPFSTSEPLAGEAGYGISMIDGANAMIDGPLAMIIYAPAMIDVFPETHGM